MHNNPFIVLEFVLKQIILQPELPYQHEHSEKAE